MTDFDYMVECNARDIALMLMEEKNISIEEALRLLYSSKTFENLKNNYGIAHTLPFNDVVDSLSIYCKTRGGTIL